MDFAVRSYKKELLDENDIPLEAIKKNLEELQFINRYLGGHHATIQAFRQLNGGRKEISVCEIGCGGGDNLMAIHGWCKRKNIKARFTGIDMNPNCILIARSHADLSNFRFIVSDYRLYAFPHNKPDIIFSSLFCHHFTNEELVFMLKWMMLNAGTGIFINDLHRHALAYHSIGLLTKFFSRSYLVKNDAPLSVLRGFRKPDWEMILQRAGLQAYSLEWKWAFRWLLIVKQTN
jgi:2-polyprenyl-3-methyl-5-hydroxy-6-metoxy-1,4-benzoquinol methylase